MSDNRINSTQLMSDASKPGEDSCAPRRHPLIRAARPGRMRRILAGIPELELFESDQARDTAMAEMEHEARHGRAAAMWQILWLAPLFALSTLLVDLAWGRISATREMSRLVRVGLNLAIYFIASAVIFRWVQRRRSSKVLREKLLAIGVPICRACGYSLRGLALESQRCPECGRPFDADVRAILEQAQR